MTLKELMRVISNDNQIILKVLRKDGTSEIVYTGKVYKYSSHLDEKYPNNNFKDYNVLPIEAIKDSIYIYIEE